MAGLLTDLSVAGSLIARTLTGGHSNKIPSPEPSDGFETKLSASLAAIDQNLVAEYQWLTMKATQAPWVSSGITLNPGDHVSWFVCGRAYASKLLDIWVDPRIQVWAKIGSQGTLISPTRLSHSHTAEQAGELCFGNYFPNDWADPQGTLLQDKSVYKSMSGHSRILVIRWAVPAAEGLAALKAAGDHQSYIANELERINQGSTTPEGWSYLFNIGDAEIYKHAHNEHGACMHCNTRADTGILQKEVSLPLTQHTTLSWQWCVDTLPSTLREDSLPSHDYMSIAVEFENGRDITYYWSHNLAEGTGYDCPLPNWAGKEYHVVVRSSTQGLGEWLNESRNVYEDYQHYMGEPPKRIVKIWLIANSAFQRQPGDCTYANIELKNQDQSINVL